MAEGYFFNSSTSKRLCWGKLLEMDMQRIAHAVIALVAVALILIVHIMTEEVMAGQVTRESLGFLITHTLMMGMFALEHAHSAFKGLKFQFPVVTKTGG